MKGTFNRRNLSWVRIDTKHKGRDDSQAVKLLRALKKGTGYRVEFRVGYSV